MTTLMFLKRFAAPLPAGTKRQTIRPPRKRPIAVGEPLSLRHWQDKAYRSPQVEIMPAVCTAFFDITVCREGVSIGTGPVETRTAELDLFAQGDGFTTWQEMREFFESRFGYGLPFRGVLIQFQRKAVANA